MNNPEVQEQRVWEALHLQAFRQSVRDMEERIRTNPVPTDLEIRAGCFKEDLEPQVRDAVMEMNRKGYRTQMSGFGTETTGKPNANYPSGQYIDGRFELDPETVERLKAFNVDVFTKEQSSMKGKPFAITVIRFFPSEPDLSKIKAAWDKIISVIPDRGMPAQNNQSLASRFFRLKYTPDRASDDIVKLRSFLTDERYSPQAKARIRELFQTNGIPEEPETKS